MNWQAEPTQALAFFGSAYDNKVTITDMCSWNDLVALLEHRIITSGEIDTDQDKNCEMFSAVLYKSLEDDYEPAPETDRRTGEVTYPVDPETGRTFIRRCAANTIAYTALLIDYDGRQTLDWARQKFARYAAVVYTSYGHLKDGTRHKFRVVIPFSLPMPVSEYESRRDAIAAWVETDDASMTAVSRGFYLPACHQSRQHLAVTWSQDGIPLDWSMFKARPPYVPPPPPERPIGGDRLRQWGRERLERQVLKIRQASEGGRHAALCAAARAIGSDVAGCVIDHHEAYQALEYEALAKMGEGRETEIRKCIESGFRKGRHSPTVPPEKNVQSDLMTRILAALQKAPK